MTQRYRIGAPRIVHEVIDGEVIIIDFETGTYFSVAGTGAEIWTLLGRSAAPVEIVETLAQRYGVASAEVEGPVEAFVEDLVREALVVPLSPGEVVSADEAAAPLGSTPPAFTVPVLERYSDMKELLLMDPIHEVDTAGWPTKRPEDRPEA